MTNEKLLSKLLEIKSATVGDITLLQGLINEIRTEMLTADLNTSEKSRFKKCLAHCQKVFNNFRPVLGYTHFENGLQYFTDSYMGVELHGSDIMENLPKTTENYEFKRTKKCRAYYDFDITKVEYPKMQRLFDKIGIEKQIDLEKLYKFANAHKDLEITLDFGNNDFANVRAENLLTGLNFANCFNGVATICYRLGNLKPLHIIKSNGTQLLISPIRNWDDQPEKTEHIFVI